MHIKKRNRNFLGARKRAWKILLLVCYLFIISGAMNTGFSAFFMAIPFMLSASYISIVKLRSSLVTTFTHVLILLSIIFNLTLTTNPIVFPVLNEGTIEILTDGYHVSYEDGSGGFIHEKDIRNLSGFKPSYIKLNKGDKYKVLGVNIGHPDFSTKINLETKIGQFRERDYRGRNTLSKATILLNKKVQADWVNAASFFMMWPMLFLSPSPLGLVILSLLIILFIFRRHLL